MAINIVRFNRRARSGWGKVARRRITPIPGDFPTTRDFVDGNRAGFAARPEGGEFRLANVEILSPVTKNQQFICQGANYRQHMIESGMDPDVKKFNMIFTKATSCIVPANSP